MTTLNTTDGPIVLAHADTRSGLCVTRSLVAAGYDIHLAVTDTGHFVCRSRFARRRFSKVADPRVEPDEFVTDIAELCVELNAAAVIPVTDPALSLLAVQRQSIPEGVAVFAANPAAVKAVLDKDETVELAERLEVPYPKTINPETADELLKSAGDLRYPLILKRKSQQEILPEAVSNFTVHVVNNTRELEEFTAWLAKSDVVPQVQEFVDGVHHNLCCFAAGGEVVAVHEYASLRTGKHEGILRENRPVGMARLDYARRMLRSLNWDGVAFVSFVTNEDTNEDWFLEINGRFWASVQGSVNMGWDFPRWVVDYFQRGDEPHVPEIPAEPLMTCYHTADLEFLIEHARGNLPYDKIGDTSVPASIWNYLRAFGPGYQSDVFRWDDPMPAIADHGRLVKRYFKGALRRLTGG
ncbi:MAG: hypothetical protein AAF351_10105 [Pseudomonadota bacterium]